MAKKIAVDGVARTAKKRFRYDLGSRMIVLSHSVLCGLVFFVLGFVSLLSGQIASELEWSRIRDRWRPKKVPYRQPADVWKSEFAGQYYGCSDRGSQFGAPVPESESNGYLLIATSGGLNQQRTGITDAVVVARILNATLIVPELDHQSFWKDNSEFADIFDVEWFISYLAKDVTVVKRVPDKIMRSMEKPPYTLRPPRRSTPEYYLNEVLPIMLRRRVAISFWGFQFYACRYFEDFLISFYLPESSILAERSLMVVQLTKFDYRLMNVLDEDLQKLRCRVNYHALRFTRPIEELGQKLIKAMQDMSPRFIAVHLRFEPDMLAFSGCYYDGGEKERQQLGEIRKRWVTLPDLKFEGEQSQGRCPLTPHEVGLMLRGLGFGNDTYIYVASGEIFGGNQTLQPLRDLFPNYYTKEILAQRELAPFQSFSSRLAAVDYIVCNESDVLVTNNNGNMAKILAGRRVQNKINWEVFSTKVKSIQRGFMGEPDEMRPDRGDFHEFPSSCICQIAEQ